MSKKLIDDCFASIASVHKYFGYVEDWCVFPLWDSRGCFWQITDEGASVMFADTKEAIKNPASTDDAYQDDIYKQRFLTKWVYRTKEYTMILCDTHVDGNKLLRIFDNKKEVK